MTMMHPLLPLPLSPQKNNNNTTQTIKQTVHLSQLAMKIKHKREMDKEVKMSIYTHMRTCIHTNNTHTHGLKHIWAKR